MTLRYTPEAIRDLQETTHDISKVLQNPKAATRIAKNILDSCGNLKQHPMLGATLEGKTAKASDLRYLVCENYIAFYRIDDDTISIARILDGRQDYLRILFEADV